MQFDAELRLRHPGRRLSRLRPGQPPVRMEHDTRSGEARLLRRCTCPLTAAGCVKRVCAELAIIDVTERGFAVTDLGTGADDRGIAGTHGGAAKDVKAVKVGRISAAQSAIGKPKAAECASLFRPTF
jgi:hypothetical protein